MSEKYSNEMREALLKVVDYVVGGGYEPSFFTATPIELEAAELLRRKKLVHIRRRGPERRYVRYLATDPSKVLKFLIEEGILTVNEVEIYGRKYRRLGYKTSEGEVKYPSWGIVREYLDEIREGKLSENDVGLSMKELEDQSFEVTYGYPLDILNELKSTTISEKEGVKIALEPASNAIRLEASMKFESELLKGIAIIEERKIEVPKNKTLPRDHVIKMMKEGIEDNVDEVVNVVLEKRKVLERFDEVFKNAIEEGKKLKYRYHKIEIGSSYLSLRPSQYTITVHLRKGRLPKIYATFDINLEKIHDIPSPENVKNSLQPWEQKITDEDRKNAATLLASILLHQEYWTSHYLVSAPVKIIPFFAEYVKERKEWIKIDEIGIDGNKGEVKSLDFKLNVPREHVLEDLHMKDLLRKEFIEDIKKNWLYKPYSPFIEKLLSEDQKQIYRWIYNKNVDKNLLRESMRRYLADNPENALEILKRIRDRYSGDYVEQKLSEVSDVLDEVLIKMARKTPEKILKIRDWEMLPENILTEAYRKYAGIPESIKLSKGYNCIYVENDFTAEVSAKMLSIRKGNIPILSKEITRLPKWSEIQVEMEEAKPKFEEISRKLEVEVGEFSSGLLELLEDLKQKTGTMPKVEAYKRNEEYVVEIAGIRVVIGWDLRNNSPLYSIGDISNIYSHVWRTNSRDALEYLAEKINPDFKYKLRRVVSV